MQTFRFMPIPFLKNGTRVVTSMAFLLGIAQLLRADNIDTALHKTAPSIMRNLESHGYKNVGVLKFQVKKGNAAPTLMAGSLNNVMATRLENALILANKEKTPIGITRGASAAAAAKDKTATFLTDAGKTKLFGQKYALAWGTESVQVDAFLTGLVAISPDGKTTTISVDVFDRKNLTPRSVLKKAIVVNTDTSILRDTNQSFVISRKIATRAFNNNDPTAENFDKDPINLAASLDAQTQNKPNVSRKLTVDAMKDYLEFKIKFNGEGAEVTPDGFVDKPAAGQKVAINVTAKLQLGLLLRVNGVNTLEEQRDEKADLTEYNWWILEPNKEYTIQGFYTNGKAHEFLAKAAADVSISEMGENADRHGKIDFDVFVSPKSLGSDQVPRARGVTFRTMNTRSPSFSMAKDSVQRAMQPTKKLTPRVVITKDLNGRDQVLETTTFEGAHVGGLSINYRRDLIGGASDK